jgi:hypothetical protein
VRNSALPLAPPLGLAGVINRYAYNAPTMKLDTMELASRYVILKW